MTILTKERPSKQNNILEKKARHHLREHKRWLVTKATTTGHLNGSEHVGLNSRIERPTVNQINCGEHLSNRGSCEEGNSI